MKVEIGKFKIVANPCESIITIALIGAVVVIAVFSFLGGAAHVCDLPSGDQNKPLAPGMFACAEFWTNRYQTLLGAFVTIGAALYAGLWVSRQIKKTDEQMEFARAQISSDFVQTLDDRYVKVKKLRAHVESLSAQFGVGQAGMRELVAAGLAQFSAEKADSPDQTWLMNKAKIEGQVHYIQQMLININDVLEAAERDDKVDGMPIKLIKEYRSATHRAIAINRFYISTHEVVSHEIFHGAAGSENTHKDTFNIFKFADLRVKNTIDEIVYNKMIFLCMDEQEKIIKLKDICNLRVDALIADVDTMSDR